MRVLIVNKFLHHVGGVETYVEALSAILDGHGADVSFFGMHPPEGELLMPAIGGRAVLSPLRDFNGAPHVAARAALHSVYSFEVERLLERHVANFRPDIVHVHSTCRQLTPAVARVLARNRIPSVLTAHEYKQVCASQRLWDDKREEICVDCVSKGLLGRYRSIVKRSCVRGSRSASLISLPEIPLADRLWNSARSVLHAPSRFMESILLDAPYISGRIVYFDLPWGAEQPRAAASDCAERVLYIGRLAPEKGVDTLLRAWPMVKQLRPDAKLCIAGDGEAAPLLRDLSRSLSLSGVEFVGRYDPSALADLLNRSAVTVHPSRWHENSPFTVRESLQHGVPAVVTSVGGLKEMVSESSGSAVEPDCPELMAGAIVAELERGRAGSKDLIKAVRQRRVSDDEHLRELLSAYSLAVAEVANR
ncbi:glycosyltransferase [Gordonia sp. VNQ95]|uniref:glycosyltransferase n=1 Tax=Gordonia sp. VNQ95 TaxID=3156619 RepID=UPI0032B41201